MNRRQCLATIGCGASGFIAGCLSDPGTEGGLLEALEAGKPPNASVTVATDDRISSISPVQEVLQRASENESGVGEVGVSQSEYDPVAQALSKLPWYERKEHNSSYPSGIYLQHEGDVFVVVLTPFCTDSMFVDAQSDRGEYGWGGCIEQ